MLIGDLVLSDEVGRIDYRGSLPLGPGIGVDKNDQSREIFLNNPKGKPAALIMPLGLAEWHNQEKSRGSLDSKKGLLTWSRKNKGTGLYAPLFIDFDSDRFREPFTWRRLTVCESLETCDESTAVGYRVQIGDEQWLIYRSLDRVANRTVLGHNLSTEMLVAQFGFDGEVEPILEVQ